MTYRLSPSSIGLMKECPRCFWLQMHEKWMRPAGIFPSLPSGMDRILKKHFDSFLEKGKLPPELAENSECVGMRLFGKNEEEKKLLDKWRENRKGIQIEDEEGNILKGAVDNILVLGDKLIVLDYKTRGYALKDDTHEHYRDQLDFYNYLLIENGFKVEDYGFLLFYYPDKVLENGEIVFEHKLVKMKANPENAKKIFEKAIKLLNGPCPETHTDEDERCEWCAFVGD